MPGEQGSGRTVAPPSDLRRRLSRERLCPGERIHALERGRRTPRFARLVDRHRGGSRKWDPSASPSPRSADRLAIMTVKRRRRSARGGNCHWCPGPGLRRRCPWALRVTAAAGSAVLPVETVRRRLGSGPDVRTPERAVEWAQCAGCRHASVTGCAGPVGLVHPVTGGFVWFSGLSGLASRPCHGPPMGGARLVGVAV